MDPKNIRRFVGIILLLISLLILIWGLWPFGDVVRTVPISPQDMQLPTTEGLMRELIWNIL